MPLTQSCLHGPGRILETSVLDYPPAKSPLDVKVTRWDLWLRLAGRQSGVCGHNLNPQEETGLG